MGGIHLVLNYFNFYFFLFLWIFIYIPIPIEGKEKGFLEIDTIQECEPEWSQPDSSFQILLQKIPKVEIKNNDSIYGFLSYSEFLLTQQNESPLLEIIKNPDLEWKVLNKKIPNFGYTNKILYARFRMHIQENASNYIIRFDFPSLDLIESYFVDAKTGGCLKKIITGDYLPQPKRFLSSHIFTIPLYLVTNQNEKDLIVFIKFKTTASLSVPIDVLSLKDLYKDETIVYYNFGLYFGIIITMFLYNSVLYFYTKERIFLSYLFFLISYFFTIFSGYGFGNRFFYPYSWYLTNHAFLLFAIINIIAGVSFTISFLDLNKNFPKFTKVLILFLTINFILGIGFAINGNQIFYNLVVPLNMVSYSSILVVSSILAKKHIYARYFLAAWLIYIFFYVITILRLIGIFPHNFFTYYGIQIGSCIEMFIISVSIGKRIYEYKNKNEQLTLELLQEKSNQAKELEKLVQVKTQELERSIENIQKDIEVARGIQLKTLPKNPNWKIYGLDVATLYLPKGRVSGDIYDLCQLDEDRFRFFIADATGHGVQAGFFTMSIRTEYERIKYQFSDTAQVLRLLNQSVFNTFGDFLMLYSCFLIDIDITQKFIQYSSAGHPEQLMMVGSKILELRSNSKILGFSKDLEIKSKSIPIEYPLQLFIYSDGLSETRDLNNNLFGLKTIQELMKNGNHNSAEDFINKVFQAASMHSKDVGFEDDITIIYIKTI